MNKIHKKIVDNLCIYRQDIKTKGLYWSIIHRIYKIPYFKKIISPIVNLLKPDFLTIEGNQMYIDKKDTAVSQELLLSGKWEEFETNLFKSNIKYGNIVLDIGAHIGYYTLIAAKIVGTKGKVYAFEPNQKTFEILKKNVEKNGYKNVILVNKAISDKNGQAELYLNEENTGDHRLYNSRDKRKSIKVETITLDTYFKDNNIKINLIKMDIQGSEVKALRGSKTIIKRNKDIKIISEFWPKGIKLSGEETIFYSKMFNKKKFKFYEINEQEKKLKKILFIDFLKNLAHENSEYYTNLFIIKRDN